MPRRVESMEGHNYLHQQSLSFPLLCSPSPRSWQEILIMCLPLQFFLRCCACKSAPQELAALLSRQSGHYTTDGPIWVHIQIPTLSDNGSKRRAHLPTAEDQAQREFCARTHCLSVYRIAFRESKKSAKQHRFKKSPLWLCGIIITYLSSIHFFFSCFRPSCFPSFHSFLWLEIDPHQLHKATSLEAVYMAKIMI